MLLVSTRAAKARQGQHILMGRALRPLDLLRNRIPEISNSIVEIDRAMHLASTGSRPLNSGRRRRRATVAA